MPLELDRHVAFLTGCMLKESGCCMPRPFSFKETGKVRNVAMLMALYKNLTGRSASNR